MKTAQAHTRMSGFSLVELLVVLAIIGVLAVAGVSFFRPRSSDAVRSLMTDLEGTLLNAQNSASLSAQDVYISTTGNWTDGTFVLDPRPLLATAVSNPPSATDLAPGTSPNRMGSTAECFFSRYDKNDRVHMAAGVDTTGAWETAALGTATDLKDLPFLSTSTMAPLQAALGNRLCTGSLNSVVLTSANRTFVSGFYIAVVGLVSGQPKVGGPIGILVVPAGSGTVYKYYKPDGSNTWRRM
jgi:prepilin-type N-terminal cleavage/methylation domain-containing protein